MSKEPTRSAPPMRELLRAATAVAHHRLHRQPDLASLRLGRLTREDYHHLLLRLLPLHKLVEVRLAAFAHVPALAWHTTPPGDSRAERLQRDVLALGGASLAANAPNSLTNPSLIPCWRNVPEAIGCAWVVEGSALGGVILARALETSLGISATNGRAFFAPVHTQTLRWQACCASVEALATTPIARENMVLGANLTFDAFVAWIETGP